MEPSELAEAIRQGAKADLADTKYGYPHKYYITDIPNRYKGDARTVSSMTKPIGGGFTAEEQARYGFNSVSHVKRTVIVERDGVEVERSTDESMHYEKVELEGDTTHGKFYVRHLLDASPDDRKTIERALGLSFTFDGESVSWQPFKE